MKAHRKLFSQNEVNIRFSSGCHQRVYSYHASNPRPCMEMRTLRDAGVNPWILKPLQVNCSQVPRERWGAASVLDSRFLMVSSETKLKFHLSKVDHCYFSSLSIYINKYVRSNKICIFYYPPLYLNRSVDSAKEKQVILKIVPSGGSMWWYPSFSGGLL